MHVETTKIKEKIELEERMHNNFLDKKLNKFYSRQNNNVEKHRILMENFLFFGSLRIMLAQSLFWTDSLANQTLTVIWQGCSNKTDLRKNLV